MYSKYLNRIFLLGFFIVSFNLSAQVDTVFFITGDFLIGEVKKTGKKFT